MKSTTLNNRVKSIFVWPIKYKNKIARFVRSTLLSAILLAIIFVAIGLAYTWYVGKNSPVIQSSDAVDNEEQVKSITPIQADPDANVGVALQTVSSPVMPGTKASVTIRTNQQATCKIKVIYKKVEVVDTGLVDKTADEFGLVKWNWQVSDAAPVGKWPIDVNCYKNNKSGYLKVEQKIVEAL